MRDTQNDSTDHGPMQRLDNPFLRMKVFANPSYFVPDQRRTLEYLHEDHFHDDFKPNFLIPIGRGDTMRFSGEVEGGVSYRSIWYYQEKLFPDDFEQTDSLSEEYKQKTAQGVTIDFLLRTATLKEHPERVFGGYDEAFRAGKTVLDIAPGQAVGLMQFALQFPKTSFLGVDILYEHERAIFPGKPGLQLTKGDWLSLRTIPDHSVDTILSLQGLGMWGVPGSSNRFASDEDGKKIIDAMTRVARIGATVRIDFSYGAAQYFQEHMDEKIWETKILDEVFIAKKRK